MLIKSAALPIGICLSAGFTHSSFALTRIENDRGDSLGSYLLKFAAIRDSGERVVIDGNCFSSCTIVTALVPRDRICVTERAALGFHASWVDDRKRGRRVISVEGTRLLVEMYPPDIRG